ncbi:Hsp70 family protein [Myxococcota bacterium]
MTDSIGEQFADHVKITVSDLTELVEKHGEDLKSNGLFVRRDVSPAVGEFVLVEFVSPDGTRLLAVTARVVHARPSSVAGDKTAGMGLEFLDFDEEGRQLITKLKQGSAPDTSEQEAKAHRREKVTTPATDAAGPVVGIDLGTTNSCVAVVQDGQPRVVASTQGYETVPSIIYLSPEKKVLAGHQALQKMLYEPNRCVYGSKRFIGRRYASKEVRTYGHFFHYDLAPAQSGLVAASIDGTLLPLELVAAHVLAHLRTAAQHHLGVEVKRAIITVPAYFGELQRHAVRQAGRLAGFEVERVLNEPTAAAVAYGYGRKLNSRVLVYDFGGGTFDASAVQLDGDSMEVLATDGDPFLGGSDLDDRLTEFVIMTAERTHGIHLRNDPVSVQRIRFAAEEAKRELSEAENGMVQVPYLTSSASPQPINIFVPVTRDLLENLTEDLVTRTLNIVQSVLDRAGIMTGDLDDLVMVGGQSRSPAIRRMLTQRFGRLPSRNAHPDHAIALGAALVAASQQAEVPMDLKDILAGSIRLGLPDGRTDLLLPRGQALPSEAQFGVSTSAEDSEFKVLLYRGEAEEAANNELLGELTLPSNLALAVAKTPAPVTLKVGADGTLTVTMQHPMTSATEKLELSLPESAAGLVLDAEDPDIVEVAPSPDGRLSLDLRS